MLNASSINGKMFLICTPFHSCIFSLEDNRIIAIMLTDYAVKEPGMIDPSRDHRYCLDNFIRTIIDSNSN